jgi:hypothetical protein
MSELFNKRKLFTRLLPRLIDDMIVSGFTPLIGPDGLKHMEGSLHYDGLAVDINLFDADGKYLTDTADYKQFGDFWKSLHPDCRWGGDFRGNPDGNHFSLTYQGKA